VATLDNRSRRRPAVEVSWQLAAKYCGDRSLDLNVVGDELPGLNLRVGVCCAIIVLVLGFNKTWHSATKTRF